MPSRLFSLVRTIISWTYLGVAAAVFALVMLALLPSRRLRLCAFNVFGRLTGPVMVFFAGASLPRGIRRRVRAAHPAILVSNHTSYLDNFLATCVAPIGTVGIAQSGTAWVPFFGNLYAISGNVLVNRRDRRAAATALRTLIDLVQRFRFSAMIWPEGGRSADGRLQPFKRGFVHLAIATRLPILPIVVSNSHRCWPKGSFFTRFARVDIQVLDPIPTGSWNAQSLDAHVTEVWSKFASALPPDQRPNAEPIAESRK
jgi:1-acyl-sn-glycerol-3-phosphate acyltransferase